MAESGFEDLEFISKDLEFSREQVEGLAARLASVKLSEHERALLLAIFHAARDHVSLPKGEGREPEPTLVNLQEQLVNAFVPETERARMIMYRIGSSPIGPPIGSGRQGEPDQR
jgi:hypothetical protein